MKQIESHKGYYEVSFRVKGQRKKFKVHRLVAIAFIPNNDINKKFVIFHYAGLYGKMWVWLKLLMIKKLFTQWIAFRVLMELKSFSKT